MGSVRAIEGYPDRARAPRPAALHAALGLLPPSRPVYSATPWLARQPGRPGSPAGAARPARETPSV